MTTPDIYSEEFNISSPVVEQPLIKFNSTLALNKYFQKDKDSETKNLMSDLTSSESTVKPNKSEKTDENYYSHW